MSALLGWFVSWPNDDDTGQTCGYGEIVATEGLAFVVRALDRWEGEPPCYRLVWPSERGLVLFRTEVEYLAWIAFWRADRDDAREQALRRAHAAGRA